MRTSSGIAIVALAVLLVACGGGSGVDGGGGSGVDGDGGSSEGSGATGSVTAADRPESAGRLRIVSPRNGAVVHGTSVKLRIRLEGARIVPQTTTDIAPDEGHLHVILDDALISITEGTDQTVTDLTPGLHRIQVEFVASDHAPFDPRVVAVVSFEVRP